MTLDLKCESLYDEAERAPLSLDSLFKQEYTNQYELASKLAEVL